MTTTRNEQRPAGGPDDAMTGTAGTLQSSHNSTPSQAGCQDIVRLLNQAERLVAHYTDLENLAWRVASLESKQDAALIQLGRNIARGAMPPAAWLTEALEQTSDELSDNAKVSLAWRAAGLFAKKRHAHEKIITEILALQRRREGQ